MDLPTIFVKWDELPLKIKKLISLRISKNKIVFLAVKRAVEEEFPVKGVKNKRELERINKIRQQEAIKLTDKVMKSILKKGNVRIILQ